MTATPYLLLAPIQDSDPARMLVNGCEAMVIVAGSSADAVALAKATFEQDEDGLWGQAAANTIAADTSIHGWTVDLVLNTSAGVEVGEVSMVAAGVKATGSVNLTAGNAADGDTFVIAGKTYTLQASLTNVDGHVLIGANGAATIANLVAAITLGSGAGTAYAAATTANASVTAVVDATNTVADITALAYGTSGNTITLAKTGTNEAVSGATLSGGTLADTFDTLMPQFVTAINAAGLGVSHAAYNSSTNVLTVAGTADNLGDHLFTLNFYPPNAVRTVAVPGFVTATTMNGSAGAALTATLAADNYTIPLTSAGMHLIEGTTISGAVTYPGPVIVSIHADATPASTDNGGVDTAVLYAGSANDAKAYAEAQYAEHAPAPWANATPLPVAAASDLTGWLVNVQVINPTPGSAYSGSTAYNYGDVVTSGGESYVNVNAKGSTGIDPTDADVWALAPALVLANVTYKGVANDTIDLVGAGLATLLNAAGAGIANAAYDSAANVLTAAGAADGLGNMLLVVSWVAPNSSESTPIPGFVTAITDLGSSGAALTATFAADSYTIPQVCAQLRRS